MSREGLIRTFTGHIVEQRLYFFLLCVCHIVHIVVSSHGMRYSLIDSSKFRIALESIHMEKNVQNGRSGNRMLRTTICIDMITWIIMSIEMLLQEMRCYYLIGLSHFHYLSYDDV